MIPPQPSGVEWLAIYICMSVYMHMSILLIKLINVLIIYLIITFVHDFVFKSLLKHIHLYLFLGLYNSSFHILIIYYTNLYCWHFN